MPWKGYFSAALLVLFYTQASLAADSNPTGNPGPVWGGEAEVGILMTRGNTHTDTQNINLSLHRSHDPWKNELKLAYLHTEESGVVSANRYGADFRSTYKFRVKDFAFGGLRFEDDRFAGFDQRTTEVAGYGRKLIDHDSVHWDGEVGLGARQTDFTDNRRTNEGIVRLATRFEWNITKTSMFKQELSVESGSVNTLTRSSTSVKVKINSSLAMKLSLKVQDNSEVPIGKKHTDTETSLTLVYDI